MPHRHIVCHSPEELCSSPAFANGQPKVSHPKPGPCSNRLQHGSTAMARFPGRAMACQLIRPAPPTSKAVFTGEVLSEAGRPQRKIFLHTTDKSCGKETPCGKSPSHLALGHRRCLIVSGFPRGCERPEMFSVADRQEKKPTPSFKQLRCMFSRFARRHIRCHEKDCNSCPHIHQRSRQDYVHQYPHWGEQASRKPLGQKGS